MSASPKPPNQQIHEPWTADRAGPPEGWRQWIASMDMRAANGGAQPPSVSDRERTIHNEQVKLTATFFNGLALAFAGGGGATAFLGLKLPGVEYQLALALVWIVVGIVLHSIARLILRNMR